MTDAITLYSKPSCPQCSLTKNLLDSGGFEYEIVDLSTDPAAYSYVTEELGYRSAPVVEAFGQHWSGFRPDLIKGLSKLVAA